MSMRHAIAGLTLLYAACGTAHGQLVVLDQFDPGLGSLVGAGFDASADHVWVYGDFDATFGRYSTAGAAAGTIARPGEGSNDADVDFATTGFTLGTTAVPAGTLLFINGETGPAEVYAVDASDGTVLATLVTAFGDDHVVGGAWHPLRGTLFLVSDQNDSTPNTIAEIDPTTGAVLDTFGPGADFTVNYGDLDVSTGSGNLFLVSDAESVIRELTPTGVFVQDFALPGGVSPSGIALDDGRAEAYVSSTGGTVYRLGEAPATTTTTTTAAPTTTSSSTTTSTTAPAPTTTTSSTTTSTSTSTTAPAPTTTTTLPAGGCDGVPDGPTFDSILCRVTALRDRASAESGLGAFQPKLVRSLEKAAARTGEARTLCGESNLKKARKRLRQAAKALAQYVHRLAGLPARKKLEEALRLQFLQDGEAILPDATLLRSQVECPAGAPAS